MKRFAAPMLLIALSLALSGCYFVPTDKGTGSVSLTISSRALTAGDYLFVSFYNPGEISSFFPCGSSMEIKATGDPISVGGVTEYSFAVNPDATSGTLVISGLEPGSYRMRVEIRQYSPPPEEFWYLYRNGLSDPFDVTGGAETNVTVQLYGVGC